MKKIISFVKSFFGGKKEENADNSPIIPVTTGKKRAILVGINDYKGSQNDLRGCLNDCDSWSKLLREQYQFDDIYLIKNEDAVKTNVTTCWVEAVKNSVAGDVLVFQYSGHGSYVPDKNGDEQDGKDECICLYDSFLIDDEIREIMSKVVDGVHVVVIFDSCFSGTATRMFSGNDQPYKKARFIAPKESVSPLAKTQKTIRESIATDEEGMKEIYLSGCNDTQYSNDAFINGQYAGAMSYFATKILQEKPNQTYTDFYKKLREFLPSGEYQQTPQLEGSAESKSRMMFS